MSFEDDIYEIYLKESSEYGIKCMIQQGTPHPLYEFDTFVEWKKDNGYEIVEGDYEK